MIATAGRLEDAERDKIEEQVGLYVRSSTENIRKLEASINLVKGLSPQSIAHRHGVVMVPLMMHQWMKDQASLFYQALEALAALRPVERCRP